MGAERVQRRLAAILAADIVGYSRLMEADEAGTLARLKALRAGLLYPKVAEYGGRVVKTTGDGTLVEFTSAVNAVEHAIDVQREMERLNTSEKADRRIELRLGINLGDIIIDDGDVYGDGVNVAARLEGLAEPGGIRISGAVHEHVLGKVNAGFEDLGEQTVKNISRPVRVYRIVPASEPSLGRSVGSSDRPAIAVLPFANMSGDPEQEYFADGIAEDVITALSRFRWLLVIARNSSFTFKGRNVDVRQVGAALGVRYVLEGSVRKAGSMLRITGQLIDAESGAHLWAEKYDGRMEDVFELQDQVATAVAGAIAPAMQGAEMHRVERKPTASLDAYDCVLRALAAQRPFDEAGFRKALAFARTAIALDPDYPLACAIAARAIAFLKVSGGFADPALEAEGVQFCRQVMGSGTDDPDALWMTGHALALLTHDCEKGVELIDRSLAINPSSAQAWSQSGWLRFNLGEGNLAIEHFQRAMRLSPLDPWAYQFRAGIAWGHFVEGRYEEAAGWADRAFTDQPRFTTTSRCRLAAYGLLGRTEQARNALQAYLEQEPDATVTKLRRLIPLQKPEPLAAYLDGLRKAGLPES